MASPIAPDAFSHNPERGGGVFSRVKERIARGNAPRGASEQEMASDAVVGGTSLDRQGKPSAAPPPEAPSMSEGKPSTSPSPEAPSMSEGKPSTSLFDRDHTQSWGGRGGYHYVYTPGNPKTGKGATITLHGGKRGKAPVTIGESGQNAAAFQAILAEYKEMEASEGVNPFTAVDKYESPAAAPRPPRPAEGPSPAPTPADQEAIIAKAAQEIMDESAQDPAPAAVEAPPAADQDPAPAPAAVEAPPVADQDPGPAAVEAPPAADQDILDEQVAQDILDEQPAQDIMDEQPAQDPAPVEAPPGGPAAPVPAPGGTSLGDRLFQEQARMAPESGAPQEGREGMLSRIGNDLYDGLKETHNLQQAQQRRTGSHQFLGTGPTPDPVDGANVVKQLGEGGAQDMYSSALEALRMKDFSKASEMAEGLTKHQDASMQNLGKGLQNLINMQQGA